MARQGSLIGSRRPAFTARALAGTLGTLLLAALLLGAAPGCAYMRMNPPPDADKTFLAANNSCYLATAANLLAGAGYGTGTTVQQRSDDIYGQLIAQFGTVNGGWTDAAMSWWLSSANNTWTTNPYTVVTVHGNKSPKNPWADANGAQTIGNELRANNLVGLSISWPVAGPTVGSGGHAITAWGDEVGSSRTHISANTTTVRLTDSDSEAGGDVQVYDYDAFASPNPGGANEGNGWYIDYDPNHPYIKHIVTLAPTTSPAGKANAQRVVGSYKIQQTNEVAATDLHYTVQTDTTVLSYFTSVDVAGAGTPAITEQQPRRGIVVDWTFEKPVPAGTWVTIDTEFILPVWNAMTYQDVSFTYPKDGRRPVPAFGWKIETPRVEKATAIPNVTGGYVVAALTLVDPRAPAGAAPVGEYRLVHQYGFDQSPEQHLLKVTGPRGLVATNLRIGHSYGFLQKGALWRFEQWLTRLDERLELDPEKASDVRIDWTGKLPYPEGEDLRGRLREKTPEKPGTTR